MFSAWSFPISYRSLAFLLIPVIMLAVLVACQDRRATRQHEMGTVVPQVEDATQLMATATPISSQEERGTAVNRIAYIGSDGNIFTIKPDGTDSRRLTTTDLRVGPGGHILAQRSESQLFYAWPTWSPDSTRMAASRVIVNGARAAFSLEVVDASTGKATKIYDNEPDTNPIYRGAPHYIYWSPDSKRLTFIASTPRELTLFISTPEDGGEPVHLVGEGPVFFSWASDSSSLLIHRGRELLLASLGGDGSELPQSLGNVGDGFRTPALSRDGTKMVYAAGDDGGDSIYLANTRAQLAGARSILNIGRSSAFLWSPTMDEVAIAHTVGTTQSFYERLTLVSSDGASQKSLVSEPLLAFFWSPDGQKIAYVAFDPERRSLTWRYVDRSEGSPIELVEFLPSGDFLTMITFFDQYAYSNSVWSPDSSQIVFSGTIGSSALGRNGGSPEVDRVYVLDIREGVAPREIASSRFATWSWK